MKSSFYYRSSLRFIALFRCLIEAGCEVNARDLSGENPLAAAFRISNPIIVNKKAIDLLIAFNADLNGQIAKVGALLLDDRRNITGISSPPPDSPPS